MISPALASREVESTTLPNGIRVLTETMPHVRSVAIGIWLGTGSRNESPAENGISHFIEHMLFKGTKNRSAEQIAREIDSSGGHLDAYTSKELVSYNTKVLDDTLPQAFDVLADLVLNPTFRAEDVEKEKGVILEELKTEVDNPEYQIHNLFSRGFWKNHPLGRNILGTRQTIKSFHPEMLQDYFERYYNSSNIVITAAGRLNHRCVVEMVGQQFDRLPIAAKPPIPAPPRPEAPILIKSKRSLVQCHLVMGVPAFPLSHPLRYAGYILSAVLGGGMSSRLFQNIREKLGLAYSVFSELSLYKDSGMLDIYAGTSVESARRVAQLVTNEFRILKNELVGTEELRRAKDYLKGSLALGLESTSSRMSNLARQELYFDRYLTIDQLVECVERVTSEEIQEIAQFCFQPEKIALALLGPLDDLRIERDELVC